MAGAVFFGFEAGTEYTVLPPGSRFSFTTDSTRFAAGDTFTLHLDTENITDLAGWQADLKFDPEVLKADSVREGGFLKQNRGRTYFQKGTIDNETGRITDLGSARTAAGGVSGDGRLLSVTFTAKANGESRISLRKLQAGTNTGKVIPAVAPDIIITVGKPAATDPEDTTFSLSTATTSIYLGDTFTLQLNTEDVKDLAGWQTNIIFDPDALEAVKVSEGDFLKSTDKATFFLKGKIDNAAGKITGISSARLKDGINGTGALLLVTFTAKTTGKTQIALANFFAGSSNSEEIVSAVPAIVITIEDRAFPAWDVNQDGLTNVLDLIRVSQRLGEAAAADPQADVNGDGTINVLDLIAVAQHLGEAAAAAPSLVAAIDSSALDPVMIQAWIAQAEVENDGSLAFRRGIENLQQLLALLLPEKTALLANYPNPFNPETWIPYHLATSADVKVRIYAANGTLVRMLALGHQAAGTYESRSRAAYWDGKNALGEPVASGVYFYTFTAGDFTATRKMLIKK